MNLNDPADVAGALGLTPDAVAGRLAALGLTPADREALRLAWPSVAPHAGGVVAAMYRRFRATPGLADLLASEARVARLELLQLDYLRELFCSPLDAEYVARRVQIGLVHHRLRVTPQWFLASYAHILAEFSRLLLEVAPSPPEGLGLALTLFKVVVLDAGVSLEAYGRSEDVARSAPAAPPPGPGAADGPVPDPGPATREGSRPQEGGVSRISLSDDETAARATFLGLCADDLARLRALREPFGRAGPLALDEFYRVVRGVPHLAALVPADRVPHLIRQVSSYWHEFFEGHFDRPHAASRMRIGVIHERIGLEPQWYLIGLAHQVASFLGGLLDRASLAADLGSFFRALLFDVTFVVDAYMAARADALLRARGYADQLMSGLSVAVVVLDAQMRVTYANERLVELAGVNPALLYLMPLADAVPLAPVHELVRRLRADRLTKVSGTAAWGTATFRVTVLEVGQEAERRPGSLAVVFDDVSTLVRLSGDIERDADHSHRLVDSISAVLWELDPRTLSVVAISRPALDLTGYRDVFFLGRAGAWVECIVGADRDRFRACCASLAPGGRAVCEYRLTRADGREIWVRSHLTRGDQAEAPVIAGLTLDVTQSRLVEEQRMAALRQVAGGIAHLVNNSLTAILGSIEMDAVDRVGPPSAYLPVAVHAARRAADVVGQLQGFAGGQFLQARPASPSSLLADAEGDLRESVALAGPAVRLEVRPGGAWKARLDAARLLVALRQLCANAVQAMPAGGELLLESRDVRAGALAPGDPGFGREWVELSVRDTGCGMAEDVRRRAVEPFFTTRGMAEANGLGLSFAYGFTSQSGGQLLIDSAPGAGTTVRLRFPRLAEAPGQAAQAGPHSRPVVLLVEDDDNVRAMTAQVVATWGYAVRVAASTEDALREAEAGPIDLLLSDIVLGPGLDGVGLARHLAARFPGLGVVLMSGYAVDPAEQGIPAGWGFVAKPFSFDALAGRLRQALRR